MLIASQSSGNFIPFLGITIPVRVIASALNVVGLRVPSSP